MSPFQEFGQITTEALFIWCFVLFLLGVIRK